MKKKIKIFDPIIFKHAVINVLKQPFYWIAFVIVSILLLAFGFVLLFFNLNVVSFSIFGFIWFVSLFTLNSYEFNYTFVIDRQAEVINMELRKGRNTKQIFISRVVASFAFAFGQILIISSILMIAAAIVNSSLIPYFIIIPVFILILNIIGWGIYLFVFSWGFNKFASFCLQIYFFITAATIYLNIPQSAFFNAEQLQMSNPLLIRKSLITDEALRSYNLENSFAKELFTNGEYLTNFVANAEETREDPSLTYIKLLPTIGFINEDDLNILLDNDVNPDATISENYKLSKIYEVNDALIDNNTLSKDYQKSIYSDGTVTQNHVDFSLAELDKVINLVNEKYATTENNLGAFNSFLRTLAKSEILNESNNIQMSYSLAYRKISASVSASTADLNNLNKTLMSLAKEDQISIHTPVGLKFWNELVLKLFYQASITQNVNVFDASTLAKSRAFAYFLPGRMTHEMLAHPIQYHNFITYNVLENYPPIVSIFNNDVTDISTLAWYYRGNTLYNELASDTYGDIQVATNSTNKNVYGMTFSYLGYGFFLLFTAISIMVISWYAFDRNTKK